MKHKTLPGLYKRTLAGWASYARKDGTNIFASKEAVAQRAGVSRWTVYRHTDVFIDKGILVAEGKHTYPNGHWTTIYRLDEDALKNAAWSENDDAEAVLQDATGHCSKKPTRHCSKTPKSHRSKVPKTSVAGRDAKGDINPVASLPLIQEASAPNPAWQKSEKVSESASDSLRSSSNEQPFLAGRSEGAPAEPGTETSPAQSSPEPPSPETQSFFTERMREIGLGRPLVKGDDNWKWKEKIYRDLFHVYPQDTIPDSEIIALYEVSSVCLLKYNTPELPVRELMAWAKVNKKGKLAIRNAAQLSKAFFSEHPNSLRRQFEQHLFETYGKPCSTCQLFARDCTCEQVS